ncbi:MAG: hypothetical protein R6V34_12510 [Bacteroidales bacterium]
MRVFILSTGRCGSKAFIEACKHIENYSAGHETLTKTIGSGRFDYNDNHIEADNRLSWDLGKLNEIFNDDAFYVHLKRDRDKVAESIMRRYYQPGSIIDSYCAGIKKTPPEKLNKQQRLAACYNYIDTVNANVEHFMSGKSRTITINLENIYDDFKEFWDIIGAEGNLDNALKEFSIKHNPSTKRPLAILYRTKLSALRGWKHMIMSIKS